MTALQLCFIALLGEPAIYTVFDAPHFALNLFLVQDWSFFPILRDQTFNAPAWSLSVEAFLYLMFFVVARFTGGRFPVLLVIAAAGLLTHHGPLDFLSRGIFCFFVGGIIATACAHLQQGYGRWVVWYLSALIAVSVLRFGKFGYAGTVLLLGAVIASLLVSDKMLAPVSSRLARLGESSYSLYLLHFPLQLVFALALIKWRGAYSPGLFLSSWAFLGFFAILIGLALISHRYFEMPVQRLMRSWAR